MEGGATDGDEFRGVAGLDSQDGVASVDGADEGCSLVSASFSGYGVRTVLAFDGGNVRDLLHVHEGCDTGQKTLAKCRVRGDDMGVAAVLDILDQERGEVLREALHHQHTHN